MLIAPTIALLVLAAAPAAGAPGDASGRGSDRSQEFQAARVEILGFDEAAVLAALRLRLPRLPIERHRGPAPIASPHFYLQLTRAADDRGAIRLITSDGRAYQRPFTVEIGQEVRVAASTAANLIFAVEQGALAPDQEDVAIPTPAAPEPAPEPAPILKAPAEQPAPVNHKPVPEDIALTTPALAPRWELGLGLHAAALLGLGAPRYANPFAGGGGGLGLELRAPRGFAIALELRGLGQVDDGLGVARFRAALAAGYALRRGRFELPILLGLAVEPWWGTRAGARPSIVETDDHDHDVDRAPLLGGFVRLSPSVRLQLASRSPLNLRLGPRIELGGSFILDDGPRVVGLADLKGQPRFRLGGLELSLGLELALQFGLPPR